MKSKWSLGQRPRRVWAAARQVAADLLRAMRQRSTLPEEPELPGEPMVPGLLDVPEFSRCSQVELPLGLPEVPGWSWPGNCAVWQAGRGSLGRQSAGAWLLRFGLLDMEPDEDDPGLVVVPWFCTDGS